MKAVRGQKCQQAAKGDEAIEGEGGSGQQQSADRRIEPCDERIDAGQSNLVPEQPSNESPDPRRGFVRCGWSLAHNEAPTSGAVTRKPSRWSSSVELGDWREPQAAMPIKGLDGDLGDGPLAIHQVEKLVLAWAQA